MGAALCVVIPGVVLGPAQHEHHLGLSEIKFMVSIYPRPFDSSMPMQRFKKVHGDQPSRDSEAQRSWQPLRPLNFTGPQTGKQEREGKKDAGKEGGREGSGRTAPVLFHL